MFSHDELEVIPNKVAKLFRNLEAKIFEDIIRRIRLTKEITRSADYQIYKLYSFGVSKLDIKKHIKETLNLTDSQIDELYKEVIAKGYARDKKLYDFSGKEFIPFKENVALQDMIKTISSVSKSDIIDITKSLGFVVDKSGLKSVYLTDYYTNKLNEASLQIISGAFDYNKVLIDTVDEMIKSGIRTIDYEKGYHNRVEVAVRRAVMSGLNQITNKISDDNMINLDTNYAEVSFHLTARPTHQAWQGRVWSKEELYSVCGLGQVDGLLGVNCYHHYDAFIPGISKRQYSDDFLNKQTAMMNKKIKFGNKEYTKYEAIQKQRQLERNLRAQKEKIRLLKIGEVDRELLNQVKAKYKKTLTFYKEFSEYMNLKMQMERVNITGFK